MRYAVLKPYRPTGRCGKVSNYQITGLIKVSILNATNRPSKCSGAALTHVGTAIAAAEAEAVRAGTINRTAMNIANGTDIGERTTAGVAGARQGQFKRRG